MQVICAWCLTPLGEKEGEGVSHGICVKCFEHLESECQLITAANLAEQAGKELREAINGQD